MTWSRTEIRRSRRMPLEPVLRRLGYRLVEQTDGNWLVVGLPGEVVIKEHYWVRTEDGTGGNAIDFLMDVEGMNFAQAMRRLLS